jgi:hypothetical protein
MFLTSDAIDQLLASLPIFFFQPVAILFSTSNASGLYRNHGMRENPLFTAQLMLNFSRSKLWRSNAIIIFSTTNTVFSRLQIAPSHEQKITILPQTESSKGKKERKIKEDCMKQKGEKSHKDLYVSYHAIDEPSLAANVFSTAKIFFPTSSRSRQILLLYIAAIIMMFKKLRSFHKRNQGKEKKRKQI